MILMMMLVLVMVITRLRVVLTPHGRRFITVLRVAWRRWWRYIVPLLHIAVAVAYVIFVVIVVGVVVVVGDCAAWWRCLL